MKVLKRVMPSPRGLPVSGVAALGVLLLAVLSACGQDPAATAAGGAAAEAPAERVVVDHWDREVTIPATVERAVVMEWEGLVTKSMQIFGITDKIVGVDTATKKQTFRNAVIPAIADATDIGSAWSGVNYEELAVLDPDVVFLEAWVASEEDQQLHSDEVEKIEALGFPVIVFLSPSNFDEPDISTAWEHIEMVGEVFGHEAEASELVARLESELEVVRERTEDIAEEDRTDVVLFATVDNILGEKSIQSYLLTEIVNANNIAGEGTFITVSEEQLLALDPEALIILGHDGYLDPELVYAGEQVGLNWSNLQQMQALQDERMVSLGYDEWRATIETPIALLKMASVIYPEKFADIDVEARELAFYEDVYGMQPQEAVDAVQAQNFIGELANQ